MALIRPGIYTQDIDVSEMIEPPSYAIEYSVPNTFFSEPLEDGSIRDEIPWIIRDEIPWIISNRDEDIEHVSYDNTYTSYNETIEDRNFDTITWSYDTPPTIDNISINSTVQPSSDIMFSDENGGYVNFKQCKDRHGKPSLDIELVGCNLTEGAKIFLKQVMEIMGLSKSFDKMISNEDEPDFDNIEDWLKEAVNV